MVRRQVRWFAALCGCVLWGSAVAAPDFVGERASDDVRYVASWVLAGADNQGKPFVIVDKRDARVYVFDAAGRLAGASAALLGLTPGDEAIPDIARRAPSSLRPVERTTPAGRFESQPGHNDKGEDIVWVDYEASLALHRLRPAPPAERRPERLASASIDDKRISFGCIIVPVAFYEGIVSATLGRQHGVVYVLPEVGAANELFGDLQLGSR